MLQRRLIVWLSRIFDHSPCIASSLFSISRQLFRLFIPVIRLVPFRSLFTTTVTAFRTMLQKFQDMLKPKKKKKALLIGICGTRSNVGSKNQTCGDGVRCNTLRGPHTDVNSMRQLLIGKYGYSPDNITVLLDDGGLPQTQPTKAVILDAMDNLVRDAKAGDRFCFHFAGHAGQTPTKDPGEEDGMDEYIVASDGGKILDDVLHMRLVKPLPPDSTLTAVMDSCHSCSLLDLKHHRCNRVFVPWISKGKRRTKTLWYETVRKQAMLASVDLRNSKQVSSHDNASRSILESRVLFKIPKPKVPLSIITKITGIEEADAFFASPVQEEYDSPQDPFCDGFTCRESNSMNGLHPSAEVICLSSSQDSQETWENAQGASMSQILIEKLWENPNPILYDMMQGISFAIHASYVDLHSDVRKHKKDLASWKENKENKDIGALAEETEARRHKDGTPIVNFERLPAKKRRRKKKSLSLEMVNFQDPELSSPFPLDMKTRKWTM